MKRAIGASCLTMALAALLAAPAEARIEQWDGKVKGGGEVGFQVKFKRGKPKLVGFLEVTGLPVKCTTGPTKVRIAHNAFDLKVRKRKFSYTFQGFTAKFKGRFNKKRKKATGTIDYGPADPEPSMGCDTNGPRRWTARK